MCYSTKFFAKSTFVKFFEISADPTLGFFFFFLSATRPVGQVEVSIDSKLKGLQTIFRASRVYDVILFQGAPKSKVPFLACLAASRGVKTLTYISVTHFLSLRISSCVFLPATILGSDVK